LESPPLQRIHFTIYTIGALAAQTKANLASVTQRHNGRVIAARDGSQGIQDAFRDMARRFVSQTAVRIA
jgi:hypothetical protein